MLQQAIREDFLHYIWRLKRFDHYDLKTTKNEAIEIIHFGHYNTDAGPDFLEGCIKIGDTIWHGQIEMHVKSSDWLLHKHQQDPRYDNVVLHVVYEEDREILNRHGQVIPCLILNQRIDPFVRKNYSQLRQSEAWIPCEKLLRTIDPEKISIHMESFLAERLMAKSSSVKRTLANLQGDWEGLFYRFLARAMGLKVNAEVFLGLAEALPYHLILKNRDNLHTLETLLFGQAGMLKASFQDPYFKSLKKEYHHLARKYNLQAIEPLLWKFSRMRPSSFPSIRIAQLASILHRNASIFQLIRDGMSYWEVVDVFTISASSYWDDHYRFGVSSNKKGPKNLGRGTIDVLIINAVIPVLFLYGQHQDDYRHCESAMRLLSKVKAESNSITNRCKMLGFPNEHAAHSQALVHLKKNYCDQKRCLSCKIGHEILKIK